MPPDEPASLVALMPRSVAAIVEAQAQLDAILPLPIASFHLTSIPAADLRFEFGLTVSERSGLFVPRRTNNRLRHLVSFKVAAVPEPIEPAPAGGWTRQPLTLFEPGFMRDPEREIALGLRVCRALQTGACTVKVPEPKKLTQTAITRAGETLQTELLQPDNPDLGVITFCVSERPPSDLVVIVTDDSDRDGVFLVEADQPPTIYSIPGDRNDAMFYEPLHRLTMALGAWLAGESPARRLASGQQLPREWGFTTLELFVNHLVDGYQQTVDLLSQSREPDAVTHFDVAHVSAEIGFAMHQRGAPSISVIQEDDPSLDLIQGHAALQLERERGAIAGTLTLVAPGFVLAPRAREAFVSRAQRVAARIAREFRDDSSLDYERAINRPADPERIVVMLSVDDPNEPFRFLVTWPVQNGALGGRHFVFRCREDGDSLGDVEAVMRASDSLADVAVAVDPPSAQIAGDVYEEFHRFFRAARVWRSGLARDAQRAALESA